MYGPSDAGVGGAVHADTQHRGLNPAVPAHELHNANELEIVGDFGCRHFRPILPPIFLRFVGADVAL